MKARRRIIPSILGVVLAAASGYAAAQAQPTDGPALDAGVITDWNALIVETAQEVDQLFSLLGHRALAMMHPAMHDALDAMEPVQETYAPGEMRAGCACPRAGITGVTVERVDDEIPRPRGLCGPCRGKRRGKGKAGGSDNGSRLGWQRRVRNSASPPRT